MAGRVILLGTGTCQLEIDRTASAVLIDLPAARCVFDFGRGTTRRLAELGVEQDQVEHIVLSHFHPDHFSDLIPYLHAALYSQQDPRREDLWIHGPPGARDLIERVLLLAGYTETDPVFRVRVEEATGLLRIGSLEADFVPLPPAGNQGLRFRHADHIVALTGDSHFHDEEVEFLHGADLAVIDSGHLDDDEIVELATRSQARVLVCSHLYRELNAVTLNRRAQEGGYRGQLIVGSDLMTFDICR
jgi:ribonuclease BN (tRNA processing enzyme)